MGKIDSYFLVSDSPAGSLRRVDLSKVKTFLIAVGAVALAVVLALPNEKRRIEAAPISVGKSMPVAPSGSSGANAGDFYVSRFANSASVGRHASAGRSRSANQLVKTEGDGFGVALPSGSSLRAKVLSRIVTSEARSPVIAMITEMTGDTGFEIEPGAKILGTAESNAETDRVQVQFHTMILGNGRELPINAVAVMADGSSGIVGEVHSQTMKREGGRLLGHFAAGFANGFKDRQPGGVFPLEPGNLKNAALGGVAESASEHSKAYSEQLRNVRPFVSVEPETPFMVFFEKGIRL